MQGILSFVYETGIIQLCAYVVAVVVLLFDKEIDSVLQILVPKLPHIFLHQVL